MVSPQLIAAIDERVPRFVCFDLFDTLVSRSVHPEDVKCLACERLARVAGGASGESLYRWRSEIELELCHRNQAAGYDPEFNALKCYRELYRRFNNTTKPTEQDFVDLCLELEIATELALQNLNPEMRTLLHELKARDVKCCLITDFYLPEAALRPILRFHNIEDFFERVFVSADNLLTKRSGRQYPIVIDALGCAPHEILMIGDNTEADYQRAREHGLRAFHLDPPEKRDQPTAWTPTSERVVAIEREVDAVLERDRSEVFPELSLTLFCFMERLYETLLARDIRDVFFLAREGQVLKRLFDTYQVRRCPSERIIIRSHYLEVSRRSTFLPSLGPLHSEKFETLFRQYRRISVEEFLLSLGLESLLPDLQAELRMDLRIRQDDLPTSAVFHVLLSSECFRREYEMARTARRKAFLAYLQSFPLLVPRNLLCLVDAGWKGTIQDNLYDVIRTGGDSVFREIEGFYIGLVAEGAVRPANRKTGLLFSSIGGLSPRFHVFNENRALFEVLLAADHGPAAHYRLAGNGQGEAVRGEFCEEPLFRERIQYAKQALENRFETLDQLLLKRCYTPEWLLEVAARRHARMVFAASEHEIAWFTSLYHVENFGVFERSEFRVTKPSQKIFGRLRFCSGLLRHHGRMNMGFWPWLTCSELGGSLTALIYGRCQTRRQ